MPRTTVEKIEGIQAQIQQLENERNSQVARWFSLAVEWIGQF